MLLRVGGLSVVTGLILALLFGLIFAVVGGVLMTSGGIMLALEMESVLAQENPGREMSTVPADSEPHDVAA